MTLKEKEMSEDKEDFLCDRDWKNYNDNLDIILKEVE
jgi:hypothetical protein